MANREIQEIARALEMAADDRWEQAGAALDGLVGPVPDGLRAFFAMRLSRQRTRAQAFSALRHDLANALTIGLANLEGMIDGAVPVTQARLDNVCDALRRGGTLVDRLRDHERGEINNDAHSV